MQLAIFQIMPVNVSRMANPQIDNNLFFWGNKKGEKAAKSIEHGFNGSRRIFTDKQKKIRENPS
jgi:hypothetical protein